MSKKVCAEYSFRLFASQKSTSLSEGGFVVRPFVELSSITDVLVFCYYADFREHIECSPTTELSVVALISVIFDPDSGILRKVFHAVILEQSEESRWNTLWDNKVLL